MLVALRDLSIGPHTFARDDEVPQDVVDEWLTPSRVTTLVNTRRLASRAEGVADLKASVAALSERVDQLEEALAAAEDAAPEPRLECGDCDGSYASEHGLKIHRAKAHGGD